MIGFFVSDFGNKGLTEMNRTRLTNDFTEKVKKTWTPWICSFGSLHVQSAFGEWKHKKNVVMSNCKEQAVGETRVTWKSGNTFRGDRSKRFLF